MQLLYLLVWGDQSNVLNYKDICFNANYRFKHEFINEDEDEVKISWEIKDIIPDNFFTTIEDNNCCIDNISEIIGINGSGKTLIYKTLSYIANHQFTERYILIYKKDGTIKGRFRLNNNPKVRLDYEITISTDGVCIFSKSLKKHQDIICTRNCLDKETDLVYLCNHYCSTWEGHLWAGERVYDYSTASLIFKDGVDSEFAHDNTSRTCINSHQCNELVRIFNLMDFLQKVEELNIEVRNINDYKLSIKNILINKVNIEWNEDVLNIAHDIILERGKIVSLSNEILKKLEENNLFDIGDLPKGADFFFILFWCFIASRVVEHLKGPNENQKMPAFLSEFCKLAIHIKREVKDKRNDIYEFKEEIIALLEKNKLSDEKEFFDKIYEILTNQKKVYKENSNFDNEDKEFNNYLEFNFSGLNSKKELFLNIIKLYYKIVKSYPFINIRLNPPISSGELSFLTLWARLYDYFKKTSDSKHAVIFIDEAETTLHPEWQKALCQNFISFIEDYRIVKKLKEQEEWYPHLHIIFASHSPMLMSDVPTGNIVFLDKDKSSDDLNNTDWKTFAGDIFEIYQKGFFLKNGSIGNFALSKLNGLIEHLSSNNVTKNIKIINMIGDELTARYLKNLIEKYSSSSLK